MPNAAVELLGQLRWAIGASAVHWRVSPSPLLAFLI
jgi:hypothetical protein